MKLGVIGAGVMGDVIVASLLKKRIFLPEDVVMSDVSQGRLDEMERKYAITGVTDNEKALCGADVVLICVKPQIARDVLATLNGRFAKEQMLISIMAGVSLPTLSELTGHAALIRSMPNIPARIGLGMTVWIATPEVPPAMKMIARMIFQAFGEELEVAEEDLINAATAISGSGPAYIFYMAENLMKAARELGFDVTQADHLTRQTFRGAMDLWHQSGERAEALRHNVTSKGGTTEAALKRFNDCETPRIFNEAVRAAYDRARELSRLVAGKPEKE